MVESFQKPANIPHASYFLAKAILLAVLVFPLSAVGEVITFEATGKVSSVYAEIDPLWDPIPPAPTPVPDPSFAASFMPGQDILFRYAFESTTDDWYDQEVISTPNIGIYSALITGSLSLNGIEYALSEGNISVELESSSESEDIYGVHAYSYQNILNPISANGLTIGFVVANNELFETDSLPELPPGPWTRSNGRVRFQSGVGGLLYEARFTIDALR